MVSTRPLISKSPSPFNNPLVTVPRVPVTIGITVTFMFHRFFQFLSKVGELILCVFPFSVLLRVVLDLLLCCLSIRLFLLCSIGFHIFTPKLFSFSCIRLLVCFRIISPNFWYNFLSMFWNVLFCQYIVLPFVDILLILLLSPLLSGLFPHVVLLFFHVLLFPFCPNMLWSYHCFQSHFPSRFWFFCLSKEILVFTETNFTPALN